MNKLIFSSFLLPLILCPVNALYYPNILIGVFCTCECVAEDKTRIHYAIARLALQWPLHHTAVAKGTTFVFLNLLLQVEIILTVGFRVVYSLIFALCSLATLYDWVFVQSTDEDSISQTHINGELRQDVTRLRSNESTPLLGKEKVEMISSDTPGELGLAGVVVAGSCISCRIVKVPFFE